MTNKEAAEELRYLKHYVGEGSNKDKALDMAITALEAQDCETCKHNDKEWDDDHCDGCCESNSGYEAQEHGTNLAEISTDCISRQAAIGNITIANIERNMDSVMNGDIHRTARAVERILAALPSAQPEITPDGTLNVSIDADIANVGRILLSQTGTQRGGLYYKDAEPEPSQVARDIATIIENEQDMRVMLSQPEIETCDTCKHGYFGDSHCDNCRVRYESHYERRTDE